MKKIITFVLCTVMLLSLVACGNKAPEKTNNNEIPGGNSTQIPDPFVDCKTIDKAEQLADFKIFLPENMPEGYTESAIRVIKGEMIEVIYLNSDNEICIRKAKGDENISGDYNEYAEANTITVGDLQITTKGADGKVNVATWIKGDYTFAISASEGVGSDIICNMIENIQ